MPDRLGFGEEMADALDELLREIILGVLALLAVIVLTLELVCYWLRGRK